MKKPQILVPVMMAFALLLTACGDADPGSSLDSVGVGGNIETTSEPGHTSEGEGGNLAQEREYPTEVCSSAMEAAQTDLKRLRAEANLNDVRVDEYDYNKAIHPLYGKCRSPEDLMAGFQEYPYVAGVTSAAGVDRFTLIGFCDGRASDRACRGYDHVLDNY